MVKPVYANSTILHLITPTTTITFIDSIIIIVIIIIIITAVLSVMVVIKRKCHVVSFNDVTLDDKLVNTFIIK